MSSDSSPAQSPPRTNRRSSFAGQTFADIFNTNRPSLNRGTTDGMGNSPPTANTSASTSGSASVSTSASSAAQPIGPISKAAQQAQQRRLSLTTLGLSGSPNQTSPFNSFRARGDSIGSANSGSFDESAIGEDDATAPVAPASGGSPTNTPFARRSSFGARALGAIRQGSFSGQGGSGGGGTGGGGGGVSPGLNGNKSPSLSSSSSSSPSFSKNGAGNAAERRKSKAQSGTISSRDAKGRGSSEGFNWSDNLRSRAERTSSIAGQSGLFGSSGSFSSSGGVGGNHADHSRAKSVAVMEPPPVAQPKAKERPRPDHFQERILKGDFYMD